MKNLFIIMAFCIFKHNVLLVFASPLYAMEEEQYTGCSRPILTLTASSLLFEESENQHQAINASSLLFYEDIETNLKKGALDSFQNFLEQFDFVHIPMRKGGYIVAPLPLQQKMLERLYYHNLQRLTLRNCQFLTDDLIKKRFKVQNITHLNFRGCEGITNYTIRYIAEQCSLLRYVDLSECKNITSFTSSKWFFPTEDYILFPSIQYLILNQCTSLKSLMLNGDLLKVLELQDASELITILVKSKSLKNLKIDRANYITDNIFDRLVRECPALETTSVQGCTQLTYPQVREFCPLAFTQIPLSRIQHIWQGFEKGVLEMEGVNKAEISTISQLIPYMKNLTHLNLSDSNEEFSPLGNEGAIILGKALTYSSSPLQDLILCRNNIGNEGAIGIAEGLTQNSSLKVLGLYDNVIGNKGATAIGIFLAYNHTLEKLILGANYLIDSEGIIEIGKALEKNISLKYLDLRGNKIDHIGVMTIGNALSNNASLEYLNVSSNPIKDEGAMAVAFCLKRNYFLSALLIRNAMLTDEGVEVIAESLNQNKSLKTLDLGHNKIGNRGIIAISNSLRKNSSLTELYLYRTQMNDEKISLLANSLKSNTSLYFLSLGRRWDTAANNNSMSNTGALVLLDMGRENKTLKSIDLEDDVLITSEHKKKIKERWEASTAMVFDP